MSSETTEPGTDAEQNQPVDADSNTPVKETSASQPLTITLPDGSESVSDAILSHREMLRAPQEHGLATDQEITHLSEAVEALSADVEETSEQSDESQAELAELRSLVEQQRRQIDELQAAVTSLAGILGTDTEWETFDDGDQ
jgi:peptidoglycan hydrolase CwlO-like protein